MSVVASCFAAPRVTVSEIGRAIDEWTYGVLKMLSEPVKRRAS